MHQFAECHYCMCKVNNYAWCKREGMLRVVWVICECDSCLSDKQNHKSPLAQKSSMTC